jgi:hypothetical protein
VTRYDRITVEITREIGGPYSADSYVFEPTLDEQNEPEFRAFFAWLQEKRFAKAAAEIAAKGPGELYF